MSDIYLSLTETPSVVTLSQPVIASSVAATVTVGNTVTVALDANSLSALENVTVTVGAAISVSNFPATQVVSVGNFPASQVVTGTVALDSASLAALENVTVTVGAAVTVAGFSTSSLPPSTVTVGNSVTIGNFPSTQTIAGTVTANVPAFNIDTGYPGSAIFGVSGLDVNAVRTVLYSSSGNGFDNDDGRPVDIDNPLPISGTVTIVNSVTIGSLPSISGTVTANNPSGALTTRFGSVTTANLSQLTSCVTNTSRKYLLAQNISAGTVTIGIGFSPTTTQGIQLAAGGGLTFDAFCPTGAVYWLGAVTGAAFTILEG